MPEGPCLRRWCELVQQYTGKQITKLTGTTSAFDISSWQQTSLAKVQVYGKQMFIHLQKMPPLDVSVKDEEDNSIWLRFHALMWGSIHANQHKKPSKRSKTKVVPNPRMVLHFQKDQFLAFYGGSLKKVDGPCEDTGVDVLSDTFDKTKAACALLMDVPVCYTLMDQTQFAGVGNIIKNEALYRTNTHPLELGTTLTKKHAKKIADEVVTFTKSWLQWEKEPQGKKFGEQMMIYWKFKCPFGHPTKRGWFGDGLKRMTVWCPECQPLVKESEIYHQEIVNTKKVKRSSKKVDVDDEESTISVQKTKTRKKRKTSKHEDDSQNEPKKQRKKSQSQKLIKKENQNNNNLNRGSVQKGKRSKRLSRRPAPVYTEESDDDFEPTLTSSQREVNRLKSVSVKVENGMKTNQCSDQKSKNKIKGGRTSVQDADGENVVKLMKESGSDYKRGVRHSVRLANKDTGP